MSNYTYADGAIHNDHHKEMTVHVSGKTDMAALIRAFMTEEVMDVKEVTMEEMKERITLPVELDTPQAEALFAKLRQARMMDEQMQPLDMSNAEKGILAFQLALRLNIQNLWQVFSTLWGTTPGTLRSAYNRANEQRKTLLFLEKLKNVLS